MSNIQSLKDQATSSFNRAAFWGGAAVLDGMWSAFDISTHNMLGLASSAVGTACGVGLAIYHGTRGLQAHLDANSQQHSRYDGP